MQHITSEKILPATPLTRLPNFHTLPNYPSHQGGASVTGVVMFILVLGVAVKLGLAIIPAQIGDYQLTKSLTQALKKSNAEKATPKQFLLDLSSQWSINSISKKPEDVFTITDPTPGSLAIHKEYDESSNLFGSIDIVNHFKGDITAADAAAAK